jgi:uncharacterized RDD family membrane protein YckC
MSGTYADDDLADLAAVAKSYPTRRPIERVGVGLRLMAALLDVAILLVAGLVVVGVSALGVQVILSRRHLPITGLVALGGSLPLAYGATEIFMAGTPGKRLLGIQIARADGVRADAGQRTARWAYKHGVSAALMGYACVSATVFSGVPVDERVVAGLQLLNLAVALGALAMLGKGRRALHDYLAGTAIYSEADVDYATAHAKGFTVEIPDARMDPDAPRPPPVAPFVVLEEPVEEEDEVLDAAELAMADNPPSPAP